MAALEESLAAVKAEESELGEAEEEDAVQDLEDLLEPIAKQGQGKQVEVDGRELTLTNLDKVLWPARRGGRGGSRPAFTKGEAIDYYARIADDDPPPPAPAAPLTRVRFPDGVEGQRFFEKRAPKHTPEWVHTAPIEMGSVGVLDFIVCDDRPTLIWLAQLAGLELHPSLAKAKKPEQPTVLAFDLDPGEPATAVECAQVALQPARRCSPTSGSSASPSTRARRGSRSTCRSTPRSPTSRRRPTRGRSPRRSRRRSPSWWSRSRIASCARARSWSTGARTTTRRPRSRSTRCAAASGPGPRCR